MIESSRMGAALAGSTSAIAVLISALTPVPANAQTAGDTMLTAASSAPRSPAQPSSPQATAPEDILKDIIVTARPSIAGGNMVAQREPETTSSISAASIAEKSAITGPLQIIATVPGVNATETDPFELSQRSNLYIRGLPLTEQGWLVEGAPTVDQAFFLPYSETWTDPDNLAGVTVIPGSSRITDPLQSAVGGEIIQTVRDPSTNFGVNASASYGSYNAQRYFGRVDSGEIGDTGIKAFASGSYSRSGTYNLPDHGTRTHVDFKVEKNWGDGTGKSSIFASYNDWNSLRSNVYTLAQFAAQKAANDYSIGNFSSVFSPTVSGNNYYKQDFYLRKNVLVASQNELSLSPSFTLNVNPYYQYIHSNSPGATVVNPASLFSGTARVQVNTTGLYLANGLIPVRSNALDQEYHAGVNTYATWKIAEDNRLLAGFWFDHWHLAAINSLNPLDQSGSASNDWGHEALTSTTGFVVAGVHYTMSANVDTFSVSDEQAFLNERLKLDVGVKYFMETLDGENLAPGSQGAFSQQIHRLLPRATVSYDLNSRMQVYGDIITSTRPGIPVNTYPNTYSVATGRVAQLGQPSTAPEYAVGEELGYRYHDNWLTADLAVFNKAVRNRQIIASSIVNGAGVTTSLSAGTERIRGATAEFGLRPVYGFSPYVNGQYLDARTESNYAINGDYLPTKGKTAPGSPKFSAAAGLYFKKGPFFVNAEYRFTDKQFVSLMDDQHMRAINVVNVGVGYKMPERLGNNTVLRVAINNVGKGPYLGAVAGVVPNTVTTRGINGSTIAAATGTYFQAAPMSVVATLSAAF